MPPVFEERKGWKIVLHPAFRSRLFDLQLAVDKLKKEDPDGWSSHPRAKLLKRVRDIIFDEVPDNPAAKVYEQGNTLGKSHRHWRRAKFMERFRLFFRFHTKTKTIIFAWISDENTLRKVGAKTDPYRVFSDCLSRGDPPDDWDALIDACKAALTDEEKAQEESLRRGDN
jgi:toxin YhaV